MTAAVVRPHDSWLHKYSTPPRHMPLSRSYREGSILDETICRSASPQVPHSIGAWVAAEEKVESTGLMRPRSMSYTALNFADQQCKPLAQRPRKLKVGGIQKQLASSPSKNVIERTSDEAMAAELMRPVIQPIETMGVIEAGRTSASTSEAAGEQAHLQADGRTVEDIVPVVPVETQELSSVLPERHSWISLLLATVSGVRCYPLFCSATRQIPTPSQRVAAIMIAPRLRL